MTSRKELKVRPKDFTRDQTAIHPASTKVDTQYMSHEAIAGTHNSGHDFSKVSPERSIPRSIDLDICWGGKFGGDLSAKIIVEEVTNSKNKANKYQALASTEISGKKDADEQDTLSVKINTPAVNKYRITIIPKASKPNDRYRQTRHIVKLKDEASEYKTNLIKLNVNRENQNNVNDVWDRKRIDKKMANNVASVELLANRITINELVKDKVRRTNDAFSRLPENLQEEIKKSIVIMDGYVRRTTTSGGFSDHSVGCAIDVNYHLETKQNQHFFKTKKDDKELLELVQDVVRSYPQSECKDFDIWKAQDVDQFNASIIFNIQFPVFFRQLLEMQSNTGLGKNDDNNEVFETFSVFTKERLVQAMKSVNDQKIKKQLNTINKEWNVIKTWIEGLDIKGRKEQRQLIGMIPLNKDFLKLMLDNGWSWGGNWKESKDYMHFEDKEALEKLTQKNVEPTDLREGNKRFITEDKK